MNITPLALEVLLHHYYCPEPFTPDSVAANTALMFWQKNDMIIGREVTSRGEFYIKYLLSIPLPELMPEPVYFIPEREPV